MYEQGLGDQCPEPECQHVFRPKTHQDIRLYFNAPVSIRRDDSDVYMHGYEHFGRPELPAFVAKFKQHILAPFNMDAYLHHMARDQLSVRIYNIPVQPGVPITPARLQEQLRAIRGDLNATFKVRVGVSRILEARTPTPGQQNLLFFHTKEDYLQEVEEVTIDEKTGEKRHSYRVQRLAAAKDYAGHEEEENQDQGEGELLPVRPLLITDQASIEVASSKLTESIQNGMLNDRPNSKYRVLTATNLHIYCYLLDFAGGYHVLGASLPPHLRNKAQGRYACLKECLPDLHPGQNTCALWAIVRRFQPE